jgi:hypothetical protein
MDRRQALRTLAVGTAAVAVPTTLTVAAAAPAISDVPGGAPGMGVGMYVDMSTAQQMSTFTIAPDLVTCGVGTFGVGQLALSGPFSMLMYSTKVMDYVVDSAAHTITAKGRMRSITMIAAGVVTEDVEHDFIAIAKNNRGQKTDRFDVHFVTPFWTPGLTNPMATPSKVRPGWARFGGNVAKNLGKVVLGGVNA